MNKEYMPLGVAVFLVASGLLFGFISLPCNGVAEGKSGLGSVAIIPSAQGAEIDNNAALNVQDASFFAATDRGNGGNGSGEAGTSYSNSKGMVQDVGASLGTSENRSEVINYIIQKGDSLPSIASFFGISTETVLAANSSLQSGAVKAGEVIKILPTSGVLYKTETGDTLASIANIFNASENDIVRYNPSVDLSSLIQPGVLIVVPNDGAARAALAAGVAL